MISKIRGLLTRSLLLFLCWTPILLGTGVGKASDDPLPNNQSPLDPLALRAFLPLAIKSGSNLPLMAGIYPVGWMEQSTVDNELKPLDSWVSGIPGGRSTSIWGTFMDITQGNYANVELPLTISWNNGYTPFINLPAPGGATAYDMAVGTYDPQLRSWAQWYKNYSAGGTRFAYIAPLQEMNGYWITYGKDPGNFILAYRRIQSIFAQEGVPAQSVRWVFAPNGWSRPGDPRFEDYYPGDAYTDVVSISAYNFGYCQGGVWEEPVTVYNNPDLGTTNGHYLDRLRALAPTKPIFIAQTATSSYRSSDVQNYSEKDRWLRDAYRYLSTQQNVRAIIYFNNNKECDWAIYVKNSVQFAGYRTGVIDNGYNYISPADLLRIR